MNCLFHTFRDFMNSVGVQQTTDWLVPYSVFSPTEINSDHTVQKITLIFLHFLSISEIPF